MKFREVTASDVELQKELLLVALWTPDDEPDHDPKVLELAHIKAYFEEWGRAGDLGLFALNQFDEPIGIVQIRHKSSQTVQYAEYPELAMAVHASHRGKGVASALMKALLQRVEGTCDGIRLGVHPKNEAAQKLYEKFGFVTYEIAQSGFPQMVRTKQDTLA